MSIYYVGSMPYSSSLSHFGIKGQKWGIRRYQNPDGTLTPAGKARYANNPDQLLKDYASNWTYSYNNATNRMNPKFAEINKKYDNENFGDNYETDAGQKYVKEISETWKKIYMDELEKDYGEASELSGLGKKWMEEAFFMDMMDDYIKK